MAAHDQNQACHQEAVEQEARHAVRIEPGPFRVMVAHTDNDVQNHGRQDQEHAKDDGHHEYRVHLPDDRQGHHGLLGLQPDMLDQRILEAEEASVHKSEERREYARAGDDRRQVHALLFIKEEAAQQKHQSLAHISEHGAEDERIGQSHEHGRVQLIVGRKAVHLHIHFKRPENLRILQLRRRCAENVVMIVLHHHEGLLVVFDLLLEGVRLFFRHPAAENVEDVVLLLGQSGEFADIEACGPLLQELHGSRQLIGVLRCHRGNPLVELLQLPVQIRDPLLQGLPGLAGRAIILVRQKDVLKMHGGIDRVNLICHGRRDEIHAPHVLLIAAAFIKNRIQRVIDVPLKLVEVLIGNPSKAVLHIAEPKKPVNLKLKAQKRLDILQGFYGLLPLL